MKVKGPKNQADFIEVLYVVVNAWGASFWNSSNTEYQSISVMSVQMESVQIPIGSENWRPLGVTGPPKDEVYI